MSVSVYRINFQIRDNLLKYIMYTPVHVLQEEGKRPDNHGQKSSNTCILKMINYVAICQFL